jgi:nuclear GTP-binding protein
MPNVGKSSFINILRNKPVCASGSAPFTTRAIQEVKLNSHVHLVDSPSIMLQRQEGASPLQVIRTAAHVDELPDPVALVVEIVQRVEKEEILRHYRIANFKDTQEMLEFIAVKKGLTTAPPATEEKPKKGKKAKHVPDTVEAAKRVIRDFLNNRLRYFSKP